MDSVTQAVLGAAMGEASAGQTLKNRAIVWGILAGTIPDLDVLSRLFIDDQIYGLVYHRGLTHSIFFTLVASPIFAWLAFQYYEQRIYEKQWVRGLSTFIVGMLFTTIISGIGFGAYHSPNIFLISTLIIFAIIGFYLFRHLGNYFFITPTNVQNASYKQWLALFFFAFLTHWIIDTCTSYGTQIFEPFSDMRISFNNISIVDLFYTVPLILGILGAGWAISLKKRKWWNNAGIAISTGYLAFTFMAKSHVDQVVSSNLSEQGIEYNTFVSSPTIANTVLWQAIVETPDKFYYGMYSLLDSEPKMKFIELPKNHHLLDGYEDSQAVGVLTWFAQEYYNVTKLENGNLQFNNLRFGLMGGGLMEEIENPYIFRFILKEENGKLVAEEDRSDIEEVNMSDVLAVFWARLKGI